MNYIFVAQPLIFLKQVHTFYSLYIFVEYIVWFEKKVNSRFWTIVLCQTNMVDQQTVLDHLGQSLAPFLKEREIQMRKKFWIVLASIDSSYYLLCLNVSNNIELSFSIGNFLCIFRGLFRKKKRFDNINVLYYFLELHIFLVDVTSYCEARELVFGLRTGSCIR